MPVVQNIVKDTTGAVVNGTTTIELVIFDQSNAPQSFQGFVDIPNDNVSDFSINIPATATIINGFWSATLRGNADIKDAYGVSVSTYYKITELANTITRTYYIQVPSTAGPYWTGNIGAFNPSTYSASLALGSLSDVNTVGKTNGQLLIYNSTSGKWEPKTITHANLPGLSADDHPQYHNDDRGDARYQPISTFGTWSPTIGGGGTQPGTWITSWEKLGNKSYHVAISLLVTGTWSGVGTLTVSLPSAWTRHATQTMFCSGQAVANLGTPLYFAIGGFIEPISVSNTAPIMKFTTPSATSVSSAYDWKLVNGVTQPLTFANGYRMDVSGVVRVG